MFDQSDAPILIVMGQSNAHGHATRLSKEEEINTPLTNVYGLSREKNQSYDIADVEWSPFCTSGMNLGEIQDQTCCLAGEFARIWEREGKEKGLPPLYVIQISIGAQGIHETEADGLNMWYPKRKKIIQQDGPDGINISLYPLACHVLKLAVENLKRSGKRPVVIGLHWNQWETELQTSKEALLCAEDNYKNLFAGFRKALGIPCPIYLYRPLSKVYENEEGRMELTELFFRMVREDSELHMVDLTTSPLWKEDTKDNGIFQDDLVHYHEAAQKWFAKWQWEQLAVQNKI